MFISSGSNSVFERLKLLVLGCCLIGLHLISIATVQACGVNAHIWMTDSAICQLPMTSPLRLLYEDQRYVDLTRLGSVFPDSGYAINHEYGEVAHWAPFVQSYIEDFHDRFGTDDALWNSEAWDEVAFILGVVSHGVEDELFDSQFLRWVEQEDQVGQEVTDTGLDFVLVNEGHTEIYPPATFPSAGAASAFQRAQIEVSEAELELAVARVRIALAITRSTPGSLSAQVDSYAPLMPWAVRHYRDPRHRGSLGHEPRIIAALLEATYQRLRAQDVSHLAWADFDPQHPDRLDLLGIEQRDESRWISLYFAVAVNAESVQRSLTLSDRHGVEVPYEWRGSRWGGGEGFTHIFELAPQALTLDQGPITLKLNAGVLMIHGEEIREDREVNLELCSAESCEILAAPELRWGGQQRGCWVVDPEMPMSDQGTLLDQEMLQDFSIDQGEGSQNTEIRDAEIQDAEIQDTEIQDTELQVQRDFGAQYATRDQGLNLSQESARDADTGCTQVYSQRDSLKRHNVFMLFIFIGLALLSRRLRSM